ncbi:MAG: CheY-like chemotaxis protein, partial [Kiritimatiellia bacterium]
DVIMPGINGPDLAAQIRANASMRDIPIIFLSASVVKTGGGKPLVDTGDGIFRPLQNPLLKELRVLEKPVTPERMIKAIEENT